MVKGNNGTGSGDISPLGKAIGQVLLLVFTALFIWVGATVYGNSLKLAVIETKIEMILDK